MEQCLSPEDISGFGGPPKRGNELVPAHKGDRGNGKQEGMGVRREREMAGNEKCKRLACTFIQTKDIE